MDTIVFIGLHIFESLEKDVKEIVFKCYAPLHEFFAILQNNLLHKRPESGCFC